MIAAARSELIKLRDWAYWVGVAGMGAFMAVSVLMTVGGAGETPSDRGPAGLVPTRAQLAAHDGLGAALGNGVTFLGITALTLVAVNMGSEYSLGTIRNLLVRRPRRVPLLLGKVLALSTYVAVAVVLSAVVGVAFALLLAPGNDVATSAWLTGPGWTATVSGVGNLIVATCGWAALGLLLAVLLRSSAAAVGAGVAYALPGEILATATVEDVGRWLPGQVAQALARGGTPVVDHRAALLRTLVWLAGALAVAVVVFHRREITE